MLLPSTDSLRRAATAVAVPSGYRLVVLFGSVARGESTPGDVDLAILGPRGAPFDALDATTRLSQALDLGGVDVVNLAHANPVLLMRVAHEGVPLYEATPTEFAEFASLAMRRYADTRKFREAVREDLRAYSAADGER